MILYIDMISGISGDMILGAFLDIGVPADWLQEQLEGIPLSGFGIRTMHVQKQHLAATDIHVDVHDSTTSRQYSDIKHLIENASLSAKVKTLSLEAFEKIASAEARIHQQDINTVHFHEVGGLDALVDIIGSFLCLEYLDISSVYASRVPLGSGGTIKCSHGIIPAPAPATLALLAGVPVRGTSVLSETVTPTGAAVLTTMTGSFGPMPDMIMEKTGYGAGKKDFGPDHPPNLLRMITGRQPEEKKEAAGGCTPPAEVMIVQTDIDDMNPEIFSFVMPRLFEKGALDVCHIPVQMKKNRPGTRLEVLCPVDRTLEIVNEIMIQTTTAGVRYYRASRQCLERELVDIMTRFGTVKVKKFVSPETSDRYVPEYEECRRIAENLGMPLKDVYCQVQRDTDRGNGESAD